MESIYPLVAASVEMVGAASPVILYEFNDTSAVGAVIEFKGVVL